MSLLSAIRFVCGGKSWVGVWGWLSKGLCNHIATPLMRGVRDMFASCVWLNLNWSNRKMAEIDQDDQYWQIDKHEVKLAFTWAVKKLKSSRNGASSLWFSISKVCKNSIGRAHQRVLTSDKLGGKKLRDI